MTEKQVCPICQAPTMANPRYPNYLCHNCANEVTTKNGESITFYNIDASGGIIAYFTGTVQVYPSQECYINGIKLYAQEARFGGIVIQPI